MIDYEKLRVLANAREAEIIDAVIREGSHRKASKVVNLHASNIDRLVARLRDAANDLESAGIDVLRDEDYGGAEPDPGPQPEEQTGYGLGGVGAGPERDGTDPYKIKGVSTYFNRDGQQIGQWVKTNLDHVRWMETVKEGVSAFVNDLARPVSASPFRLDYQTDIIPWIQIGDAHLGMLAHAAEVGENFDLKIAESELCAAINILIDELPNCERMVINDLGDFTHYENMSATTEASGHALDFDTRFPKMIRTYSRVMRFIIDKALTKARHVDVIINQGNHSRTNDLWMVELLTAVYGETDRVHVLNNDNVFIAYRMGNTLVMTHHSDKCRPNRLAQVMTSDYRTDYGETEFHYIDIGHVHHGMVMKEHPDIFIESFNHLASLDRWAHDNGYRNRKSITTVLRSKTYGEVGRRVLPIQQIRDRIGSIAPMRKLAFSV